MKKKSLLILSAILLVGCSTNLPSSDIVESGSSEDSTEITTSEEIKVQSKWGEEYTSKIIDVLGEDIPFIENDGFDLVTTTDDFGDPLLCFYVYYDDVTVLEDKLASYMAICQDQNYEVIQSTTRDYDQDGYIEYDIYYADKIISETQGIEIQFLEGSHDGKECIGLFAFNYPYYDKTVWPSAMVESVIGQDAPHLPENDYEYTATLYVDSYGDPYIDIAVGGSGYDEEDAYYNLLSEKGFTIDDSEYDDYGYFAVDPDKKYCIQFKMDINYYYCLEILIYLI